ncbi:hypothetical protein V6N12_061680 [Hibiscus sabdariffa]|uniref:Geminivirus AL1 replication-associated protein central domain-containing protein n=1 Tax=Hibiscus sabdariffa TaxID=183260 RepID=A0ABR2DXR9_9ROSI
MWSGGAVSSDWARAGASGVLSLLRSRAAGVVAGLVVVVWLETGATGGEGGGVLYGSAGADGVEGSASTVHYLPPLIDDNDADGAVAPSTGTELSMSHPDCYYTRLSSIAEEDCRDPAFNLNWLSVFRVAFPVSNLSSNMDRIFKPEERVFEPPYQRSSFNNVPTMLNDWEAENIKDIFIVFNERRPVNGRGLNKDRLT